MTLTSKCAEDCSLNHSMVSCSLSQLCLSLFQTSAIHGYTSVFYQAFLKTHHLFDHLKLPNLPSCNQVLRIHTAFAKTHSTPTPFQLHLPILSYKLFEGVWFIFACIAFKNAMYIKTIVKFRNREGYHTTGRLCSVLSTPAGSNSPKI